MSIQANPPLVVRTGLPDPFITMSKRDADSLTAQVIEMNAKPPLVAYPSTYLGGVTGPGLNSEVGPYEGVRTLSDWAKRDSGLIHHLLDRLPKDPAPVSPFGWATKTEQKRDIYEDDDGIFRTRNYEREWEMLTWKEKPVEAMSRRELIEALGEVEDKWAPVMVVENAVGTSKALEAAEAALPVAKDTGRAVKVLGIFLLTLLATLLGSYGALTWVEMGIPQ